MVERNDAFVFIVDINGFQLNATSPHRSAHETIYLLFGELIQYDPEFLNRNRIGLIFNKCDTPEQLKEATEIIKSLNRSPKPIQEAVPIPNLEAFRFDFIMSISAINMAENKNQLLKKISKLVKRDFGDYSQRRTGSSQRRISDEERENKLKESLRRTRYTEPDIETPEKNPSFSDFLR